MSIDTPHFAFPFRRLAAGHSVVVNEQDLDDDVMDCVEVLLSTQLGERIELPEYGLPEQIFKQGGIDPAQVEATIDEWEPRAAGMIEPEQIDGVIQRARVRVSRRNIDG